MIRRSVEASGAHSCAFRLSQLLVIKMYILLSWQKHRSKEVTNIWIYNFLWETGFNNVYTKCKNMYYLERGEVCSWTANPQRRLNWLYPVLSLSSRCDYFIFKLYRMSIWDFNPPYYETSGQILHGNLVCHSVNIERNVFILEVYVLKYFAKKSEWKCIAEFYSVIFYGDKN